MYRMISLSLLAVGLCSTSSGCCCRIPLGARFGGPPVVINPPPVVVNPPPFQPPVVVQNDNLPPMKDNPFNKDNPLNKDNPFNKDEPFNPFKDGANPVGGKPYVYSQATGRLTLDNKLVGTGYSGKGVQKNQGAFQNQKETGPIPVGTYLLTDRRTDPNTGEPIVSLLPEVTTNTFQRVPFETFSIGPDSNQRNNPPGSGIVMPRHVRESMQVGGFTKLRVVP